MSTFTSTQTLRSISWIAGLIFMLSIPAIFSDGATFKIGLVLIFLIAAFGLHLLVNWTGELSLAHGAVVGLSALSVAAISSSLQINSVALIPVGVLVGALCGLVMAAVAFRVKGFFVAIVTLALSVAISSYFFKQEWLVGSGTVLTSTSDVGPLRFVTPQDVYPVLAVVTVASTALFVALSRSKYRRALLLIKADPQVASSQGINVSLYRSSAYVVAGAMAGLAGAMTSAWVGVVSPATFPQQLSFTYLIVVVFAGPGSLFALIEVVLLLQGFQAFVSTTNFFLVYLGPLGFILTLTKFPGGLSEQNRDFATKMRRRLGRRRHRPDALIDPSLTAADRGADCEHV
ncbi:branched-chain amino acid ABC transporter permease [Streptomyces sp. NPDC008343]|uniref:branched-chain amino acid ABC transporter permease n=1 Tax=Streptomyces sp. NPDC008343 TaxID=3364828 RepID=UPI0036E8532B